MILKKHNKSRSTVKMKSCIGRYLLFSKLVKPLAS